MAKKGCLPREGGDSSEGSSPATGDQTMLVPFVSLLGLAAVGIAMVSRKHDAE